MMNNEMMRQLQARIQKMQDDLARESVEASAVTGDWPTHQRRASQCS